MSKDFRKWTIYQSLPTKIKRSVIELKKKIAGIVEQACKEHIKYEQRTHINKEKKHITVNPEGILFLQRFRSCRDVVLEASEKDPCLRSKCLIFALCLIEVKHKGGDCLHITNVDTWDRHGTSWNAHSSCIKDFYKQTLVNYD